jgi:hypothetical protein
MKAKRFAFIALAHHPARSRACRPAIARENLFSYH